jgi:hypothetical protein
MILKRAATLPIFSGDKIIRPISTSEREKKRTKVMLKMHV